MNDPVIMGAVQRRGDLNRHGKSFAPGKTPPAAQFLLKRMPFHQFHHVVVRIILLTVPQKPHDIRVAQLAQGLDLFVKPLTEVFIVRQRLRQHFDRDRNPRLYVNTAIDRPHTASTKAAHDFKRTKMGWS